MHTLSLFPGLLNFVLVAPLILRVVTSYYLVRLGSNMYKNSNKLLSIMYFVVGGMLFVGIYTQAIVIVGIVSIIINWWVNKKISPTTSDQMMLYVVCGAILLSLLVTGPGAFAIDLPL